MCSSLRRNFSFRNRLALPCWAISTASTSPAITSPAKLPQPSGQRRWILSANLYLRSVWRASKRSEEHTSELQSRLHLVCRLLLEKKKKTIETGDDCDDSCYSTYDSI